MTHYIRGSSLAAAFGVLLLASAGSIQGIVRFARSRCLTHIVLKFHEGSRMRLVQQALRASGARHAAERDRKRTWTPMRIQSTRLRKVNGLTMKAGIPQPFRGGTGQSAGPRRGKEREATTGSQTCSSISTFRLEPPMARSNTSSNGCERSRAWRSSMQPLDRAGEPSHHTGFHGLSGLPERRPNGHRCALRVDRARRPRRRGKNHRR